jgi:hypothetical protein
MALGPIKSPLGTGGLFPWQYSGQCVKVTTHHQMPGLRMGRVILPHYISSWCDASLSTGKTLPFISKAKLCELFSYYYHNSSLILTQDEQVWLPAYRQIHFNNDNQLASKFFTLSKWLAHQTHETKLYLSATCIF